MASKKSPKFCCSHQTSWSLMEAVWWVQTDQFSLGGGLCCSMKESYPTHGGSICGRGGRLTSRCVTPLSAIVLKCVGSWCVLFTAVLQFCREHLPERAGDHHALERPFQRARRWKQGGLQLLPGRQVVRGGAGGRLSFPTGRAVSGERRAFGIYKILHIFCHPCLGPLHSSLHLLPSTIDGHRIHPRKVLGEVDRRLCHRLPQPGGRREIWLLQLRRGRPHHKRRNQVKGPAAAAAAGSEVFVFSFSSINAGEAKAFRGAPGNGRALHSRMQPAANISPDGAKSSSMENPKGVSICNHLSLQTPAVLRCLKCHPRSRFPFQTFHVYTCCACTLKTHIKAYQSIANSDPWSCPFVHHQHHNSWFFRFGKTVVFVELYTCSSWKAENIFFWMCVFLFSGWTKSMCHSS